MLFVCAVCAGRVRFLCGSCVVVNFVLFLYDLCNGCAVVGRLVVRFLCGFVGCVISYEGSVKFALCLRAFCENCLIVCAVVALML